MAYEETTMMGPSGEMESVIKRMRPDVEPARSALVKEWSEKVKRRRDWLNEHEFKRITEDMQFTEGRQINGKTAEEADEYVVNLCISHVNDRVATLYAKNPKAVAKRVPRMDSQAWDGKIESVQPVDMRMAQAVSIGEQPDPADLVFMAEVSQVLQQRKMIEGVGRTLEILFNYFLREGQPPFKTSAKQLVRRVETCGAGFVKLGFQRVMARNNEIEAKIADFSDQLAHLEMLSADMADQEFNDASAKAEELKQAIAAMQTKVEVISREGLVFDFPGPKAVIPGPGCKHLRGFVGASWIAEEHNVSKDEIKERFNCDIGSEYSQYKSNEKGEDKDEEKCRWFEIYDLKTGLIFHIVDGYCDFLEEPKASPVYFEQGHPYFTLTFNNLESEDTCYPPSDVRLIRPMQKEINRAEEGLREHRIASRPGYLSGGIQMDERDRKQFADRVAHEIIDIKVPAGTDVSKIITGIPTAPIDPMMYDTQRHFINMQRVTKSQESNFGGTQGSVTATESTIAAQTQLGSTNSNVDDLDDFLTALARASGQVMLDQMSQDQVVKIAGAGAVWPELSRTEIAEEVFLEIKAGSSGAPNVAQELANFERVAQTLLQVPGIQPKKIAGYMLERLDTGIDLDEWITEGLPSIQAMNAMAKAVQPPGASGSDPNAQGPQGADNAPAQPGAQAAQPLFPAPGMAPGVMAPGGPLQ